MSAINGGFLEFKQQCGVKGKIITTYRSEKILQSRDIVLKKHFCRQRKKRLFGLCKKHGVDYLSSAWNINFDVRQIISIRPNYNSTYLFIFFFKKRMFLIFLFRIKNCNLMFNIVEAVFEKSSSCLLN